MLQIDGFQRKSSREKTFMNFTVFLLFVIVFSAKFGGVTSFGMTKISNPRKLSPQKLYILPIYKSFLPQKFPVIHVLNKCLI